MHKKFEINQTKIKGCCQSVGKVVPHNCKRDLPLVMYLYSWNITKIDFETILCQISHCAKSAESRGDKRDLQSSFTVAAENNPSKKNLDIILFFSAL